MSKFVVLTQAVSGQEIAMDFSDKEIKRVEQGEIKKTGQKATTITYSNRKPNFMINSVPATEKQLSVRESFSDVLNKLGIEVAKDEIGDLVTKVEQWSKARGLDQADSAKQYLKVGEETGEVAAALARNDKEALKDGIGDVVVTMTVLAQQNGLTLRECLETAYNEIANRKGKMVNGVFVKEEDLI